ncbi:bifunctional folylpolyglutamate synthase/dihydrofolate synthase [Bacillus solitudinis]|uniref:bifunctional folylpolyglutamate synthase/dihydrofolate synthase n=1 Tax=Bacillus solitudinis TaxID=2014074 RepID=UPI000C24D1A6|nr:folylpolyglutamate synthase/dihydrofolate synthase family protein [Bacillus solitudinis]
MRSLEECINWIHSLLPFGVKPGLKRMEWMLDRIGNPEKDLRVIHVGGTNGKGSTVSFMRHILQEEGYTVGTFTSPYIEMFQERISVNGVAIEDEALITSCNRLFPLVEELKNSELGSPTEFEVITTIAFDYFSNTARPDIVLLEVGLGGRLDSTNVLTPLLSIITSIGYDHMHILGNTLEEIASEKAGIIKSNVPVIVASESDSAWETINRVAKERKAQSYRYGSDIAATIDSVTEDEQYFSVQTSSKQFQNLRIQMKGHHQIENAALAIFAIDLLRQNHLYEISDEAIRKGLAKTSWIGRFETVLTTPLVVIDGAHNKEGFKALHQTLQNHYPSRKYRFLIAATQEKDMKELLAPFKESEASFVFTSFQFFRAQQAEILFEQAPVKNKRVVSNWQEEMKYLIEECQKDEMIVVAGSLYFISEVRRYLKDLSRYCL